jgi:hypothetical protein
MDHVQTFRRHADDCRSMAKIARDPASRAAWNQMAERWMRCAQHAELSEQEERRRDPRHKHARRMPRVVAIQKERRAAAH